MALNARQKEVVSLVDEMLEKRERCGCSIERLWTEAWYMRMKGVGVALNVCGRKHAKNEVSEEKCSVCGWRTSEPVESCFTY